MHGRLKVRTTEEQEERRRKEREKKLKIYQYAMSQCLTKNTNMEYDETGLKITEEILGNNGDIQTLWNIRKETITKFEKDQETFNNDNQMIKMYADEMVITENCLKKNPKSYACWEHRRWCLSKSNNLGYGEKENQLNWNHELKLCSLLLESDERNFHCWRHRSFVIENGNLSKLNELEFTHEKISSNFSNYSAWHYRSKLIEFLYKENQIDLDIFKKELNLIEQALFTDPNDQSAWIYEKWLLQEQQRSHIASLSFDLESNFLSFKLTKKMNFNNEVNYLKLNGKFLESPIQWLNDKADSNSLDDSTFWKSDLSQNTFDPINKDNEIKIEICLKSSVLSNQILLRRRSPHENSNKFEFKSSFNIEDLILHSELIIEHLNNILDLSDLESGKSKWCLLTLVELMCSVDFAKYKKTIFEYLDKLANEVDVYRKNFYLDLKNKIRANNYICEQK